MAINTDGGWELTSSGVEHVRKLAGPLAGGPVARVASNLRGHLAGISNASIASFVEESIKCLEQGMFRASIVLSWVGALALIYEHVVASKLGAFNEEARRRNAKWKNAKTADDLARMKEFDFLQVCESISVIGKSTKNQLEGRLKLRNGCGHPNSLQVKEAIASAHVETLILNVFEKFSSTQ